MPAYKAVDVVAGDCSVAVNVAALVETFASFAPPAAVAHGAEERLGAPS
jgi:hypothetical protein